MILGWKIIIITKRPELENWHRPVIFPLHDSPLTVWEMVAQVQTGMNSLATMCHLSPQLSARYLQCQKMPLLDLNTKSLGYNSTLVLAGLQHEQTNIKFLQIGGFSHCLREVFMFLVQIQKMSHWVIKYKNIHLNRFSWICTYWYQNIQPNSTD